MLYIIGGATASGKSKLAIEMAQQGNGEIINADSVQLYKNIPILSAAPTDLENIPHHLFGIYEDQQISTVYNWLHQALPVIEEVQSRNKTPIIVGGTGLYLKALTHGLSPIPSISPPTRERVRLLQATMTREAFYQEVLKADSSIQGVIHPNDKQRLVRALEVKFETGRPIRSFQNQGQPMLKHPYQYIVVSIERQDLYTNINQRALKMVEQGAIEEVQQLQAKGLTLEAPVCKALGVKEIWGYLEGKYPKSEMISLLQQSTRHYAKRQITWFRHQV